MNKTKKLLACAMATAMAFSLTACEEEAAVNSGSGNSASSSASNAAPNQPGAVTTATSASTTTDPNEALDMTDKKEKVFDTSLYQPSGNAGTLK